MSYRKSRELFLVLGRRDGIESKLTVQFKPISPFNSSQFNLKKQADKLKRVGGSAIMCMCYYPFPVCV